MVVLLLLLAGAAETAAARWISRRAANEPGDFPFDERTRRGLREAAELLSEAQELAQQQTLAELMGSSGQLVLVEPELLLASSNQLVTSLVCLINALPGRDVMDMVLRRPRLCWWTTCQVWSWTRLERIVSKLVALHPSHSHTVVAGIIEENPELLFRMDYYLSDDIRLIDQLPIEIANMMYWNNKLAKPATEQEWQQGSSGNSSSSSP
ncbi:hypothetical protein COO60DRAFT_1634046 [Scenedesmus sp. NREL 46B-D3]|nr:hypothetical protein COO60DRAFT_1634046 [Scenedesmus sp. NREL 46B-D3]